MIKTRDCSDVLKKEQIDRLVKDSYAIKEKKYAHAKKECGAVAKEIGNSLRNVHTVFTFSSNTKAVKVMSNKDRRELGIEQDPSLIGYKKE